MRTLILSLRRRRRIVRGSSIVGGVTRVHVDLSRDFEPVHDAAKDGAGAYWYPRATRLSAKPDPGVVQVPLFEAGRQLYGILSLGTFPDRTYRFALDLIRNGDPVMYFDFNANGDLGDDGPPIPHAGEGRFSAEIGIPFERLVREVRLPGELKIWMYSNEMLWPTRHLAHYSVTAMKGAVVLDGRRYLAYVAETKVNDADFTNDGIRVDANRNGRIEREEFVAPGKTIEIDGRRYAFDVSW